MDPAARRHYLREQLGRTRDALERGAPDEALAAIDRALQVDPDYLAAQALRERVLRQPAAPAHVSSPAAPGGSTVGGEAPPPAATPFAAGVQRFEARARARRIEKRAEAARAALASGRLGHARAAIDEIAELDPQHPEHHLLLTELDARAARGRRRLPLGPAAAAVAVFGASLLMARYADSPRLAAPSPATIRQPAPVVADHTEAAAPAGPDTAPAAADDATPVVDTRAALVPTSANVTATAPTPATSLPLSNSGTPRPSPPSGAPERTESAGPPLAEPASEKPAEPGPQLVPIEPSDPSQLPGALATLPQDTRARSVERTPDVVTASRPIIVAPVPATPAARDEDLVLRALQQYRRAYDTLDARAAQAVWPGVDGVALQRAFDGLVSQRLTFQSCQLQVSGARASAACRGTARYTPRMGSRESRDEPRAWRFTLRRTTGNEWQIESALVAR